MHWREVECKQGDQTGLVVVLLEKWDVVLKRGWVVCQLSYELECLYHLLPM